MRPTALLLVVLLGTVAAQADEPFVEVNRDYVVRFAKDNDPFVVSKSGLSPTTLTTADGKTEPGQPAHWTMRATVQVFHVVALGPRSWVRVEIPAHEDDFMAWNLKRLAMAQLTESNIAELSGTARGQTRLQELRKRAEQQVKTRSVWMNLDQAVVVADVPSDLEKPAISVSVAPTGTK